MNKNKKQLVALLPLLYENGLELKYMNDIERWVPSFMAYRVDKAMKSFGFRIAYRFDELPTDREIANGDVEGYSLRYAKKRSDNQKNQVISFNMTAYSEDIMEVQIAAIEDNALPNEKHEYNHFADKIVQSNNPDDFIKTYQVILENY